MVATYLPFWLYMLDSKTCICMVGMFARMSFEVAILCGSMNIRSFMIPHFEVEVESHENMITYLDSRWELANEVRERHNVFLVYDD